MYTYMPAMFEVLGPWGILDLISKSMPLFPPQGLGRRSSELRCLGVWGLGF